MQYPEIAVDNVKPTGFNGKQSVERLLELSQQFHEKGLYAVPKKKGDKIAHWKFWMKRDGHIPLEPTIDNLREWLPSDDIDGLILAVGKSLGGRLIVLDIDPHGNHVEGKDTFDKIQALSPSRYVFATPGNGIHIYYRLPEGVPQLKPANSKVWDNTDIRCKNSLLGLEGNYQQYTDKAAKKGVAFGHVGYYRRVADGDYSEIPEMSIELYNVLWEAQTGRSFTDSDIRTAEDYEKSKHAEERLKRHFAQDATSQERIIKECLDYVLNDAKGAWTRNDALEVSFAAYHGSNGSTKIRDYIAYHKNPYWGNRTSERDKFISSWDTFEHREGGITVATLFWRARKCGWLGTSFYEIPESRMKNISVRYIQSWIETLDTIPERCLLMSQTGSGKTYSLKYLYERLGKPKTVVFVPTTKLAMDLAATLMNEYGLPTTLYIDVKTGRTKSKEDLLAADILITTLQTFGTKIYRAGVDMSIYGLVYIEESDQLLQQFARGANIGKNIASHVSAQEAVNGYAALKDIFESSGVVWAVDATMSMVTYTVAEALRADYELTIVKNIQTTPKAAVFMLESKADAYQVVLDNIRAGRKVVAACDTAQVAEELTNVLLSVGALDNKRHILITKKTEHDKNVHAFMENVNAAALSYDFVAYNSVMASGVSITSFAPDVFVQIATYLTPRANIQMLNRYRKQTEVYCYYHTTENIYTPSANELMDEAQLRASIEAGFTNTPLAGRDFNADLRERITAISVADEMEQNRSARDFYINLLRGDGREVKNEFGIAATSNTKQVITHVRKVRKEQKEDIRMHWIDVPPLAENEPAPADYDAVQTAKARIHGFMEELFSGEIPDAAPETIYDIVMNFRKKTWVIDSFQDQLKTLNYSERQLLDRTTSIMMLANRVTMMRVLTNIHYLYTRLDEDLTPEKLEERAPVFMAQMTNMAEAYDAVIYRERQRYEEVYARSDNDVDRAVDFAKIMLSYIGLKQRSVQIMEKGVRKTVQRIVNIKEFNQYLEWRKNGIIDVLTTEPISANIDNKRPAIEQFKLMDEEQKDRVINLITGKNKIDFATAVLIALDESEAF